jgi:hypothetical protein
MWAMGPMPNNYLNCFSVQVKLYVEKNPSCQDNQSDTFNSNFFENLTHYKINL